jgi:hypothetical protein
MATLVFGAKMAFPRLRPVEYSVRGNCQMLLPDLVPIQNLRLFGHTEDVDLNPGLAARAIV